MVYSCPLRLGRRPVTEGELPVTEVAEASSHHIPSAVVAAPVQRPFQRGVARVPARTPPPLVDIGASEDEEAEGEDGDPD